MRRYLLFVVLGLCTFGIMITYYLYGAVDHLPSYKLITVQGEAQEGKRIELSGHYGGRMRSEPITIGKDGSRYSSRETTRDEILNSRGWIYNYGDMRQWIQKHRQFMRGKDQLEGFYKDEEWLVYVTGSSRLGGLQVERLNLKTNEEQSYSTQIPDQLLGGYFNIVDVQKKKDQLHVIVLQNTAPVQSDQPILQYFKYVLNFEQGTLIQNEQITHFRNTQKDVEIDYTTLSNYGAPNGYLVFPITENKITNKSSNSYTSDVIATHLYVYSYETGKLTMLPDPKQKLNSRLNFTYTSDHIFYATNDDTSVQLSRYKLATGTEERDYVTLRASQFGADVVQSVTVSGNRAYIAMMKGKSPIVAEVDTLDGSVRYVGEVTSEGPASEQAKEMKQLEIYNLNIKDSVS